uniref:Uncharacterized protein n=1 Tax=Anguilla anguilla TaxID=7936 RepID=A0A0E9Y0P4_ANGAN
MCKNCYVNVKMFLGQNSRARNVS